MVLVEILESQIKNFFFQKRQAAHMEEMGNSQQVKHVCKLSMWAFFFLGGEVFVSPAKLKVHSKQTIWAGI